MPTALRLGWWGGLSSLPVAVPLTVGLLWLQSIVDGVSEPLWILGALFTLSVALHEAGHGLVIALTGVRLERVRMRIGGLDLQIGPTGKGSLFWVAVGGPLLAALVGCAALALGGSRLWAVALFVFGMGHLLTLLFPSADGRAAWRAVRGGRFQ